jgi:branched-chain amino acid transport system permease protein
VVLAVVLPLLAREASLLNEPNALILVRGACLAMVGLSLNVLLGYAGQVSLGQYAFVGIGAFTTGIVTGVDDLRLPWLAGLVAAGAVGALLALLVGLRPCACAASTSRW